MDLALNNLYRLICHKTQTTNYDRFESARDNFGKFIHQFQPETKTLIRKLENFIKRA